MSNSDDFDSVPFLNTVSELSKDKLNEQVDKYHAQRLRTLPKKYPVQFELHFTTEELEEALKVYESGGFGRSVSVVEELLDQRKNG